MSEQSNNPVTVVQKTRLPAWTAGSLEKRVQLGVVRKQLLNLPPHYKAEDLSGHTFTIVALKPFKSSYDRQDHAYFATCMEDEFIEEGGVFTTVLGGQLIVEALDAVVASDIKDPLEVTMEFVNQGEHGGYYVIR